MKTAIASGTFGAKIQRHDTKCVTNPPNAGPATAASPHVAATIPSAAPRRSCGTTSPMAAVATGKMPPAPSACSARAASKRGNAGAAIAITLPAAKSAMHPMYTLRRPYRSASALAIAIDTMVARR